MVSNYLVITHISTERLREGGSVQEAAESHQVSSGLKPLPWEHSYWNSKPITKGSSHHRLRDKHLVEIKAN